MTPPQQSATNPNISIEDDRTGLSSEILRRAISDNLYYIQGKFPGVATVHDNYMALAYTIRDRLLQRWLATVQTYLKENVRVVCFLSAEFLCGPHLSNNLIDLGIYEQVRLALEESGLNLQQLLDTEEEPGLGNGGLGRLASCYLDSLSTLEIPAIGYGIRYEFGIFDQIIKDGWQLETTDKWLKLGNPWEIARPETAAYVKFGGHTESYTDQQGNYRVNWVPAYVVKGIPYDTPILGYKVNTANTMRLWRSEACESFDFTRFNQGDYYGSVNDKVKSENLSKVLYPNDDPIQGKELRLEQQYFFVSCSLQDMIRLHTSDGDSVETFHEKFTAQLNDTHPSIGIAELMRLLVDEHHLDWERAWHITQNTFNYTNHTLLPEALEKWSLDLFGRLLPRHLEIIYEINERFLDQVRVRYPGDVDKLARLSLIGEGSPNTVRMAYLATVGSGKVNGVAQLHSQLLKETVMRDFYEYYPEKFTNVTNGVTPRRWMVLSNPRLTQLISEKIGEDWIKDLYELKKLEVFAADVGFRQQWYETKQAVKGDLAAYIQAKVDIAVNPSSLFDIQVKRIHEYKRQHLNALHIVTLYHRLKQDSNLDIPPRTFVFGGKAAPGYFMAKLIIKLINSIAEVVNNDPDMRDRLKVVFLPDYNVTLGQRVYPAADLSEQISTAGKEASGTGCMKFSLNGALTIGTLDGANVEIRQEVGDENFFLFGMTAQEVETLQAQGYHPRSHYESNNELKAVIDLIGSGHFSGGNTDMFRPLVDNLLYSDPFMLLADYQSYIDAQDKVSQTYKDRDRWTRMSILNVARMGKFSSDRSIHEYCHHIWHVEPVKVSLSDPVL